MKFEKLRREVQQAEGWLRELDFTDEDIQAIANHPHNFRWAKSEYFIIFEAAEGCMISLWDALKALAKAEREEIERLKKETK